MIHTIGNLVKRIPREVSEKHSERSPGNTRDIPQPLNFNHLPVSGKAGKTTIGIYNEHEAN